MSSVPARNKTLLSLSGPSGAAMRPRPHLMAVLICFLLFGAFHTPPNDIVAAFLHVPPLFFITALSV